MPASLTYRFYGQPFGIKFISTAYLVALTEIMVGLDLARRNCA